ncbi:hypothetical protein L218DRAFT_952383 [Marasmius fiardii PR-910]|nr:hypothetical protein L218DRAFT_952383 [Marasmius fiardii PR-910]
MFFSQELLARRDSGFGLLWLAATLGSKSTFKKLPKRCVLTADISQLCNLIAQPEEPLALRLSSNLMIGVARVYRVKQDIFYTDVTNCVTSLKKVVQDLQTTAAKERVLQMAQPTVRPSALNLSAGPRSVFIADFDAMVDNWDRHLNISDPDAVDEHQGDQEFDSRSQQLKQKVVGHRDSQQAEDVRAEACTLKEHHDHFLSASLDRSFQGIPDSFDPSSSQIEPAFPLGDNFFEISDGLGLDGGLVAELARELGEGWGSPFVEEPTQNIDIEMNAPHIPSDDFAPGFTGDDFIISKIPDADHLRSSQPPIVGTLSKTESRLHKENATPRPGNQYPTPRAAPIVVPPSPANSFSRLLLSQDENIQFRQPTPFADITTRALNEEKENRPNYPRKNKRTRFLLDVRTELTDEELKIARVRYVEEQRNQRREIDHKKLEKDSGKVVEELIWGVPTGIEAPSLIDLWQENFKVQVEARTGAFHIHIDDPERTRPIKRRKLQTVEEVPEEPPLPIEVVPQNGTVFDGAGPDTGFFSGIPPTLTVGASCELHLTEDPFNVDANVEPLVLRSSEEPGQARHIFRQPSVGPDFSLELGSNEKLESQKSSLFPWDNAGADISSSVGGVGGGSDRVVFERADVKLSSLSRRESSLPLSQHGSLSGIRGVSPGDFGRNSQIIGEEFLLRDDEEEPPSPNSETQRSDLNLVTLERNSFNFLEYVKMQQQAMLGGGTGGLPFDTIAPIATSTRHVAAAAFYHCLVLAAKDLVRISQAEPYGSISVNTNL